MESLSAREYTLENNSGAPCGAAQRLICFLFPWYSRKMLKGPILISALSLFLLFFFAYTEKANSIGHYGR